MTNINTMNWFIHIAQNMSFYHGSRLEFPIGFMLEPQKDGYVFQNASVEKVIERYRPVNKISRYDSVFLVDNPDLIDSAGGYTDYIYVVEPIGQVDKSDLAWYTEMEVYLDLSAKEKEMCARNYWNGVMYKDNNAAHSLWEYRCRSARIIDILSE